MTVAHVLPFLLYLVLTPTLLRLPGYYPWLYGLAAAIVAGVTVILLRGRGVVRPHRDVVAGLGVGVVGGVLWIMLSELRLEQSWAAHLPAWLQPRPRPGFNPFEAIAGSLGQWIFIAVRMLGLVVLVPVVEEVFWRGFLLRWVISPKWEEVPLGRFTWGSFLAVVALFMLAHPEWLAAAAYGALLNGLLYWKRDLWNCIVAHGVSNLALGVYILATGAWHLW